MKKGLLLSLPLKIFKIGKYLASYKQEGGCLVHFVRLATTVLKFTDFKTFFHWHTQQ